MTAITNSNAPNQLFNLPLVLLHQIASQTGTLSTLSRVSKLFRKVSHSESCRIFSELFQRFGINVLNFSFHQLHVQNKSMAAKIDALFTASQNNLSRDATSVENRGSGSTHDPMFFRQFLLDNARSVSRVPHCPISQAQYMYQLLGDEKWREGIDGVHHHFGPYVYDRGLHGRQTEPGFLDGLANGYRFLNQNFHRELDAAFYLELHRELCGHFRGDETQTLIGQEGVGHFRNESVTAFFAHPEHVVTSRALKEFQDLNERLRLLFGDTFCLGKIVEVNDPFDVLEGWRIDYQKLTSDQVRLIFDLFVSDFYWDLNQDSSEDGKIAAIAKLIQHLEWLHPPKDGCGRTDTALLNFLLTKYGGFPVLLEFPYVSSCLHLDAWIQQIKQGMLSWREFAHHQAQEQSNNNMSMN